jgi:hypothetical protein
VSAVGGEGEGHVILMYHAHAEFRNQNTEKMFGLDEFSVALVKQ